MDGVESAIRGALARGDARDRSFRERVYRSVFAALEKRISEAAGVSAEEAQRRRESLKHRIVQIEREFAVPPPVSAPSSGSTVSGASPPVEAQSRDPIAANSRQPSAHPAAPDVEMRPRRSEVSQDRMPADDGLSFRPRREFAAGEMALPGVAGDLPGGAGDEAEAERRRPWGLVLIAAVIVAILGIGAWWALETGLFGRDDGSVPNPPVQLEEEEFEPGQPPPLNQDGSAQREWITVFSASDPSGVRTGTGASVEPLEDEGQPFLRVRSGSGGAAIAFPVDRAALAAVAGGPTVFNVVARAEEGRETQMSVSCDFGVLGDCGRRRYVVGVHRADFLFDLELGAGEPPDDASISIVTDVDGEGRAIDLFEIRLAPAE